MIKKLHFTRSLTHILATVALAFFILTPGWVRAQYSIAAGSTNYTQDFNTLTAGTWTDGTTLTGWYAKTTATASITAYGANTGSTTTAGLYAFGVAGTNTLTDRGLGYVASNSFTGSAGTGKGYIGWRLVNNTGSVITSLTVTWTGEQWRKENNASSHTLNLFYQTGATVTNLTSGTWTTASSTFTSPIVGATTPTVLDGNASANRIATILATITVSIAAGEEIMLRWEDLNDSGNDHYMAIDDVTVNATVEGGSTPSISVTGTFSPFSTTVGTPSASQSVAVSGSNLTENIDISAVTGFEYSTTNAEPWTSTLSLASSFSGSVYVRLTGASLGSPSGTISFTSTGATPINKTVSGTVSIPPPANDNCAGAIALVLDAAPVTGDVANATQSIPALSCGGYTGTADDDVWYSFTTTSAGVYSITVIGSASFDAVVDLRSGSCNGTNIDCADADPSVGGTETITTSLSAATTYYVRVYSYDATAPATTTFTIGVAAATSPTVSVSTFGLIGFTYMQGSGPSAEQTFTVEGANLTENLSVSPSTNYEVSLTSGSGYSTPISLAPSSGSVATTTIYVRLKAGLTAGTYNDENIAAISTGAATQNVTCFGTVTAPLPTLPLYENFEYTVGTDLTLNGWNVTGTNTSPTVAVTAASISYPGYLSTGIGNEVAMTVSGQDVNKVFAAQSSGTVYASFLVNVSAVATGGDYFFHLGETTIGSTYRGRVFVKRDASNNLAFGIAQSTTPVTYTDFSYALNTTYLIVLKFDMVAGTSNDVSSIYINPPLNSAIPAVGWLANTDASGSDLGGVGSIALRQGGASAPTLKLDGIRVSTSWSDIVGAIPAPTISGFTPSNVCEGGSANVEITGTNFTGATAVTFNSINAASFTVDNAGQITATTPVGVSTGKISITTPGGTVESTGDFTVNPLPVAAGTIMGNSSVTQGNTGIPYSIGAIANATSYIWAYSGNGVTINGTGASVTLDFSASATSGNLTVYGQNACGDGTVSTAFAITVGPGSAPNYTIFTGTGNWTTSTNWDPGIPGPNSEAIIDGTATITTAVEVTTLTINATHKLIIESTGSLTVTGILTNSAGNSGLVIKSGGSLISTSENVAATVERTIEANDWHLISSPMASASSQLFQGHYLQRHTESTNQYTDLTLPYETLTAGKGFALWGDLATASFTGNLNAVDVGIVTTSDYADVDPFNNKGWNLVGNPFASSIDWDAITKPTGINDAIYIHVDGSTWATYGGGVGVNAGGTKYIAPCQGFFVRATSSATLTIPESSRVHNNTAFFKNSDESVPDLVRLEISGNGYKDESVVRLKPEATAEFDGNWDAYKLFGGVAEAPQIYTFGPTPLAINAFRELTTVPVGVRAGTSGTYTIAATEINDLQNVKLEDTKTGIMTDLTSKSYTFDFTAGENESRFKLHFTALGVDEKETTSANIYSYQQTVYVNLADNTQGDIYIYNLAGQLVKAKESASGNVRIGLTSTGVYMVKVVTQKETLTQKVVIR